MLQGPEYQNWYQVLRPIGSYVTEPSRVEILKLADESDLLLRDYILRMLKGYSQKDDPPELVFLETSSEKSLRTPSNEEAETTKVMERTDSYAYLSPRLKEHDQENDIKTIFWDLLKSVDPQCSEDIDVQAIRDFLAKRQAELGKGGHEGSDDDLFETYGLGLHSKTKKEGDEEGEATIARDPGMKDGILSMIDEMVAERMKPIPEKKDMYDKNRPLTGKVGFRRDEIGGVRQYTDKDEQLDFGDVNIDVDFKKYLVQKGKGQFDSKGNFISFEVEKEVESSVGGGDHKSRKGKDEGESVLFEDSQKKGKKRRGRSRKGEPSGLGRTESEILRYMEDLKKSRRHPEWDFPMCNYPKWVHRMYRMDQEKIGQLIKQGMDTPEYCSPGMQTRLNEMRGAKDTRHRGNQPLLTEGETKHKNFLSESDYGEMLMKGSKREVLDSKPRTQADGTRASEVNAQRVVGSEETLKKSFQKVLSDGTSKLSFGLDEFLQGYEKDMVDLSKVELNSGERVMREGSGSYGIVDLINDHVKKIDREEQKLNESERKNRQRVEDEIRKIGERQEMARKRIEDRNMKKLQEERLREYETEGGQQKLDGRLDKLRTFSRSTTVVGNAISDMARVSRKGKKPKKIPTPQTIPCSEFKTYPRDLRRDKECMIRFKALLDVKNQFLSEEKFIQLSKQIPLFTYQSAPPKKTPCERVELPIC